MGKGERLGLARPQKGCCICSGRGARAPRCNGTRKNMSPRSAGHQNLQSAKSRTPSRKEKRMWGWVVGEVESIKGVVEQLWVAWGSGAVQEASWQGPRPGSSARTRCVRGRPAHGGCCQRCHPKAPAAATTPLAGMASAASPARAEAAGESSCAGDATCAVGTGSSATGSTAAAVGAAAPGCLTARV